MDKERESVNGSTVMTELSWSLIIIITITIVAIIISNILA